VAAHHGGPGVDPERLVSCRTGWAPTFDALLALDRDDPAAPVERAAALQTGDRITLARLATTFAGLGCPYQHDRTLRVLPSDGPAE